MMIALQFILISASAFESDCVCLHDPHPSAEKIKIERQRAFETSPAVFRAKVIGLDGQHVRFQVMKVWRGVSLGEVVINTGYKKGTCRPRKGLSCSRIFELNRLPSRL